MSHLITLHLKDELDHSGSSLGAHPGEPRVPSSTSTALFATAGHLWELPEIIKKVATNKEAQMVTPSDERSFSLIQPTRNVSLFFCREKISRGDGRGAKEPDSSCVHSHSHHQGGGNAKRTEQETASGQDIVCGSDVTAHVENCLGKNTKASSH